MLSIPVHPHLRGAYRIAVFVQRIQIRFIPTYVGHTAIAQEMTSVYSVHPHLRGAYRTTGNARQYPIGSSPPTWGIPAGSPDRGKQQRFIPTYVGHTRQAACPSYFPPVHPHLRGAYGVRGTPSPVFLGSSPPTWGILPEAGINVFCLRFIPTYVGHTIRDAAARENMAVHPHLRGAYRPGFIGWRPQNGSSPPTWGIRVNKDVTQAARGFIPTYVGHTTTPCSSDSHESVHPHLRGAYKAGSLSILFSSGSSPPTWGIRG